MMEAYIRQKRATPGMVQASDLQMRPLSGSTTTSTANARNSSGREIHAYEGPMQFMMSPNNPDQILTASLTSSNSIYSEGTLNNTLVPTKFNLVYCKNIKTFFR